MTRPDGLVTVKTWCSGTVPPFEEHVRLARGEKTVRASAGDHLFGRVAVTGHDVEPPAQFRERYAAARHETANQLISKPCMKTSERFRAQAPCRSPLQSVSTQQVTLL